MAETGIAGLTGSPWLLAAVLAIVFFAAIVQFGLGMGFGLTAAPLLAILDPELVPASTLFIGLATSLIGATREREAIVWREVWLGAIGRGFGIVLATAILAGMTDRKTFSLVFGLMVALAVVISVSGWRLPFSRGGLFSMATVSGVMGTITSVGAPPLAIVYQDRPAAQARPTLAAFFAVGCLMSLIGLYASGWAHLRDAELAGVMVPGMIAGYFASRALKGRFDRRYRPALLSVTAFAALVLVIRGLS